MAAGCRGRSHVAGRPTRNPPPAAFALLVAAVWIAAALPAGATCTSTDSCLQSIDAAQRDLRTLSARFVQTKHVSLLDEPLVSSGRFYFARPDRMRLDIEQPRPATIVIHGRDISIPGLQPQERQAMAGSPMAAMFTELGAMFAGSSSALTGHFAVAAKPVDGTVQLTLTPTEPAWQKLFRTIELRFAEPDLTIRGMRLDDAIGDRLDIEMQDVQRNPVLPSTLFDNGSPEAR